MAEIQLRFEYDKPKTNPTQQSHKNRNGGYFFSEKLYTYILPIIFSELDKFGYAYYYYDRDFFENTFTIKVYIY